MKTEGKTAVSRIFRIGGRQYEFVEVDDPFPPGDGEVSATQFDHAAGVLRVSRSVPVDERAWAVAVAVSDACYRLWRPIPVIWPDWTPVDRPPPALTPPPTAGPARRSGRRSAGRGLAGGRPPS